MNFNQSIIIVADLGQLKAYRVVTTTGIDPQESMQVSHVNRSGNEKKSTNLELIFDADYLEAHTRVSEDMSDKTGRFKASTGEPHNMLLEKERRGLKQIADDINTLIAKEAPSKWCLAFPKETNPQLKKLLDVQLAQKLVKNIPSNLTKINKSKLLSHFE